MEFLKVVLTSFLSVVSLFLITKIMGRRQVAELDFFDYITGITIGSIAAELATDSETPWKPLLAMVIYGGVSVALSLLCNKSPRSRKLINGDPMVLMDNGKLYRKNLKKAKLDLSEFLMMCRQQGYFDLKAVQTAVFEYNGKMTILPVSTERPATPSDLNLSPEKASVCVEVIMDGRVMRDNLQQMGVNEEWLNKQLALQGHHDPKEIFLGVCDGNKQLRLFTVN